MDELDLIAVVLRDGSIELLDADFLSVRSFLFEYPHHQLRAAQDPEQPVLPSTYRLKRGMTYYLFPEEEASSVHNLTSPGDRTRCSVHDVHPSQAQRPRSNAPRHLRRSKTDIYGMRRSISGQLVQPDAVDERHGLQKEDQQHMFQRRCTEKYNRTGTATGYAAFHCPKLVLPDPATELSTPNSSTVAHSWSTSTAGSSHSVTPKSAPALTPRFANRRGILRTKSVVASFESDDISFLHKMLRQQSLPVARKTQASARTPRGIDHHSSERKPKQNSAPGHRGSDAKTREGSQRFPRQEKMGKAFACISFSRPKLRPVRDSPHLSSGLYR